MKLGGDLAGEEILECLSSQASYSSELSLRSFGQKVFHLPPVTTSIYQPLVSLFFGQCSH